MTAENDPLDVLTHDHHHLTSLVLAVRERLAAVTQDAAAEDAARQARADLTLAVERLRDELLTHFAIEEEGLFPFVATKAAELREGAVALEAGHDAVCGAVSRLLYLVQRSVRIEPRDVAAWTATFERFQASYAAHAQEELAFLREIARRLGPEDRRELRVVLAGL